MKKNILILGAGFGGLRVTNILFKEIKKYHLENNYQIFLFDKNDYHTYTPLLYEIATTPKEISHDCELASLVTIPIKEIIEKNVNFVKGEIEKIDFQKKLIYFNKNQSLQFDYLVIALGSVTNDFGIGGVKKYGLELKSFIDAIKIKDKIFEKLKENKNNLKIVIGGGGTTGVELAGELQNWLGMNNPSTIITIIEKNEEILNSFPTIIQKCARQRLKKLGVQIITKETIEKINKKHIILKSKNIIPYDIFIWTGGIKGPDLLKETELKINRNNQIEVNEEMLCLFKNNKFSNDYRIFALGDCVYFLNPEKEKSIPQVARVALDQAKIVAFNILEKIKLEEGIKDKENIFKKYQPKEYPFIIPIGGKYAITKIGFLIFTGVSAWFLKGLVELFYLLQIIPLKKAIKIWLKGLKVFIQNDHLG